MVDRTEKLYCLILIIELITLCEICNRLESEKELEKGLEKAHKALSLNYDHTYYEPNDPRLKHTSYHIIVTLWLTIQRHRNSSIENQTKSPVSNMKNQVSSLLKKNGLHK